MSSAPLPSVPKSESSSSTFFDFDFRFVPFSFGVLHSSARSQQRRARRGADYTDLLNSMNE